MNRYTLFLGLLLSSIAAFGKQPPNILLIFADDIGYEALESYGGLDFKTPQLNRMAAEGIRFTRAYTSPVCTPSRVSLHTGLYTTRHGHTGVLPVHHGTDKKVDFIKMPTFAQLMRKNGYATSTTGKWQLATLEVWPDHVRESGFDSWCIWQIWKEGEKTLRHWNATFNQDGKIREDIADRFGPDVLADYVIDQMKAAQKAKKPFMIVHNELLPHFPIIQTPDDRKQNQRASLGNMIHYMDKLVGKLMDAVTDLGIRDNTYVIFMGDNGTLPRDFPNPMAEQPGQGNHTRHTWYGNVNGGKAILGDAGTHVPLLVWGPDSIPQGSTCEDLIDVVDLFPTFCELSGTRIPESLNVDGRTIVPQIHGKPGIPRKWVHQGIGGEENLFDGKWRLFRKADKLWDARSLPSEPLARKGDSEAESAKQSLQQLFGKITKTSSRPPEAFPAQAPAQKPQKFAADVVVYGDASGGVTAAVQAARQGKDVILISQYGHLGGLTSSGLGWTDIGKTSILGGLSREFYHRVYKKYDEPSAWVHQEKAKFPKRGQGAPTFDSLTKLASVFEPKVAEEIFEEMIEEAGVRVMQGRIDLKKGVVMECKKIHAIRLEGGQQVEGKMFIDASYEGDLLAAAGVTFRMGREANSEYDEQGNGNTGAGPKNQLPKGIDPYIVKGDPSSGLLPGVNPDMGGEKGDADHRFQAYCYRFVMTDSEANRVQVQKPTNYKEPDFELLFRTIEAGQKSRFFKTSPIPNRKTDSNNTGGMSFDFIGANYGEDWNWATLNHKAREVLAEKHRDWQLGLVWTLQNHPRVPESIRTATAPWGLCKDEFPDNGHIPYNLYVREARRMHSDFVMTEKHCRNQIPVDDSIGMGAYTLDSHNVQRFVQDGMVRNEGDIQSYIGKPYPIAYRSIIPKVGECTNLLVPWSLSATHIAFGSIRMEPVFMILGQSAASAACIAIDDEVSVQEVDYEKLRYRLEANGQVLYLSNMATPKPKAPPPAKSTPTALDPAKLPGVVVDDSEAKLDGLWIKSKITGESLGGSYHHDGNARNGKCVATFTATLPKPGKYELRIAYTHHTNRATNAPVLITLPGTTQIIPVNLRKPPPIDNHFLSLGTFEFGTTATVSISNSGVKGYVVADGFQWIPVK